MATDMCLPVWVWTPALARSTSYQVFGVGALAREPRTVAVRLGGLACVTWLSAHVGSLTSLTSCPTFEPAQASVEDFSRSLTEVMVLPFRLERSKRSRERTHPALSLNSTRSVPKLTAGVLR